MMTKKGSNKIVNFIISGKVVYLLVLGCGHIFHIVRMYYCIICFKFILLLSIDQTNWVQLIDMVTKKGSTKSVNFITQGTKVLVVGHDHLSFIKMLHFFKKSSLSLLRIDQVNWVDRDEELGRVNQNCKFFDPRARSSKLGRRSIRPILKILYFLKNLL